MPATIDTITPGRGRAGDTVTIAGSGYGPLGTNAVTFDGFVVPGAQVQVVDSETLVVVVPAGIAINRHVVVQVFNGVDNTLAGSFWWSKLGVVALLTDRLPAKTPGFREKIGPGQVNLRTIEAGDFERAANKLEELPVDALLAAGDLAMVAGTLGIRPISPAADGTLLTRVQATGGEYRARELAIHWWGKQVAAATVTEIQMVANAVAGEAGQFGEGHPAFVASRLAMLSLFIAPSSTGTASRITRVRILVNSLEVLDTDALSLGQQPFINRDDAWTIAPWLLLAAGDEIRIAITKNNTFDTLDVFAMGVIL